MLTEVQRKALVFIEGYMERTGGVCPSFHEIREHLGTNSQSGVDRIVTALVERGFVRCLRNRKRSIEVLRPVSRMAYFTFDRTAKELKRVELGEHMAREPLVTVLDEPKGVVVLTKARVPETEGKHFGHDDDFAYDRDRHDEISEQHRQALRDAVAYGREVAKKYNTDLETNF